MTSPFSNGEVVIPLVRTLTGRDQYGNGVYTLVPGEGITGCAFVPQGSVELTGGRDTVTDQDEVLVPSGVDLTVYDAVKVRGITFQVDGVPQQFLNPFTGWQPPTVVRLKKVDG